MHTKKVDDLKQWFSKLAILFKYGKAEDAYFLVITSFCNTDLQGLNKDGNDLKGPFQEIA